MRLKAQRLEAAQALLRRGDFEGAGAALLAGGGALGLEAWLENTPSHDLMYSTPPEGRRVPESLLRALRSQASRRRSAPLWALAGAAELAAGRGRAAERALTRALELEPSLTAGRLLRAAGRLGLARSERDNRRLPLCLADLDRVLTESPSEVRALRLRAEVNNDLDNFEGARQDLERAVALDPANGWARAELADLLCDAGRLEEAWPLIESLGRRGRGQGWYWALRGRALATSGRAREGLRDLDKAVRLSPRSAAVVAWRGECRRALGRHSAALGDFDRAITMDPGFVYAYEWRARLLLMLGRPAAALRDAEFIVRRDARHRYGPALRGEALFKLGRYREAARAYDQIPGLDPRQTWTPEVPEGRLTRKDEREAAFWGDLEAARKRSPRDAALLVLSGRFKGASGRRLEALEDLTLALRLAGRRGAARAEALAWRGRTLLDMGAPSRAVRDLEEASGLLPAESRARAWKAEALALLGREYEALLDYARVLDRPRPELAFAYLQRARLHGLAGRWGLARRDYAQAFALDVKSGAAREGLAQAQRRIGEAGRPLAEAR